MGCDCGGFRCNLFFGLVFQAHTAYSMNEAALPQWKESLFCFNGDGFRYMLQTSGKFTSDRRNILKTRAQAKKGVSKEFGTGFREKYYTGWSTLEYESHSRKYEYAVVSST